MPFEGTAYTWISAAVDLGLVLVAFVAGRLVARLASRLLARVVNRTESEADDLLVDIVARHLPWWIAAAAVSCARSAHPCLPGPESP